MHFVDTKVYREDENHHLVIGDQEDGVSLHRNAVVLRQIGQVLGSLVCAGCFEIDPRGTFLAGSYGRIRIGTPDERSS